MAAILPAFLTGPDYSDDGGNANAYAFTGTKWTTRDPKLKWVLKNDANMAAEGLSESEVQSLMISVANTWDDASNQNLFADSSLVTLNPNVKADSFDRYNPVNTINWMYSPSVCLAYTRTWSKYGSAIDSDIVFNTKYGWDTNGITGLDVQSIALHEMGHTLGLDDLYGKPVFKSDTRQVMHYYTGIKRTLGNGDLKGIWNLYQ